MSTEKRYKTYLLVSLICTLVIIYAVWLSSSTFGESLRGNNTEQYVSICEANLDGDRFRTGNQLFQLSAVLQVAQMTNRQVAMVRYHPGGWLDRWFSMPVRRIHSINRDLCPCHMVYSNADYARYSPILLPLNQTDIDGKSLLVCGYFQSWKYTLGIEPTLRHYLQLLPGVSSAIHQFLDQIRPPSWKGKSFSRVGIHVRAGTGVQRSAWEFGYVIPQPAYFEHAMRHFVVNQSRRIQFIVTSDSMGWVQRAINFTSIVHQLNRTSTKHKVLIDLVHSEGHNAGFDLGLLSLCDGVIMSTGSYGWWGAWLANKTTIYYSGWPRPGSELAKGFSHTDYFPPQWIPIGGPAFSWRLIQAASDSIRACSSSYKIEFLVSLLMIKLTNMER